MRVVLDDGHDSNTWVTFIPIHHPDAFNAILAAGEAFALFVRSLERDSDVLTERLKGNQA